MAWKFNVFTNNLDYYESAAGVYVAKAGDTMSGNLDMGLNSILNVKLDPLDTLPSPGNAGRIVFLTSDQHLYLDQDS